MRVCLSNDHKDARRFATNIKGDFPNNYKIVITFPTCDIIQLPYLSVYDDKGKFITGVVLEKGYDVLTIEGCSEQDDSKGE